MTERLNNANNTRYDQRKFYQTSGKYVLKKIDYN